MWGGRSPPQATSNAASEATRTRGTIIQAMLRCDALTKTYRSGGRALTVLNDISFTVDPGGYVAVVGPSGSGKTTLLGLLAGLDRPTSGTVHLDGDDLTALDGD